MKAAGNLGLDNLSVQELYPAVESALKRVCWSGGPGGNDMLTDIEEYGSPEVAAEIREQEIIETLNRAGLKDPLAKQREIDQYHAIETAEYEAGQRAANEARWKDR